MRVPWVQFRMGDVDRFPAAWPLAVMFALLSANLPLVNHYLGSRAVLLLTMVMAATWLTFSPDLTYLQMPFVLLLLVLPRADLRDGSQPGSRDHGS
jgi:uncharacterized membrane protein YoaT (DUF817 family)